MYEDEVQECLNGAVDLHVHSSPDVMPRKGDDVLFAFRAQAAGMGGFVLKSHHVPTADRASLVRQMVKGVELFGAICLNNFVGGINPQAVDIAGRLGAKVIWLPTVDAKNEAAKWHEQDAAKRPYWAGIHQELLAEGHLRPPIAVLTETGELVPELRDVVALARQYGMAIATGHLSPEEAQVFIRYAHREHLPRIIVTHPEFPTTRYPLDVQRDLTEYGVVFERTYTTPATGKVEWATVFAAIKATGPDHNVLATDLGQPTALFPDQGLADFIRRCLAEGFTRSEVQKMTVVNPRRLLF